MGNKYCPLCSNDPIEPRIWCTIIEQPICSSCDSILRQEFSQTIDFRRETGWNPVISQLIDVSELPLAECVAIWLLNEIDRLSVEFSGCYERNDYATESWSRPMIRELIWRLDEIDALSALLCQPHLKDTPQAKHHKI
jgi:hypothetical protein